MAVEVVIEFDGKTPGINSKTLSLQEFGRSLKPLLSAVRGSAARLILDEVPPKRIGHVAEVVDLRLSDIDEGSLKLTFIIAVTAASQFFGTNDEKEIAAAFLKDVKAYSSGLLEDTRMRNYMETLPRGVSHVYRGYDNGEEIDTAVVGAEVVKTKAQPSLRVVDCKVDAVRVKEGKEKVAFKDAEGEAIHCVASAPLIEKAFALRHDPVSATILFKPNGNVLIAVRRSGSFVPKSDAERLAYTLKTWDGTLRRLAE